MVLYTTCRVLRELLGSVVAGCQGEAKQRKHLLSKALKRAHNVLGNHQLVSQAGLALGWSKCEGTHVLAPLSSAQICVKPHHTTRPRNRRRLY